MAALPLTIKARQQFARMVSHCSLQILQCSSSAQGLRASGRTVCHTACGMQSTRAAMYSRSTWRISCWSHNTASYFLFLCISFLIAAVRPAQNADYLLPCFHQDIFPSHGAGQGCSQAVDTAAYSPQGVQGVPGRRNMWQTLGISVVRQSKCQSTL